MDVFLVCSKFQSCYVYIEKKVKKAPRLPMSLLDTALNQCEQFLRFTENEELEEINEHEMLDIDWDAFLQQYYQLCQ